ncbi:MAG: response regulator [Eubacterium sp.]|nr:response regulator [Eubacterium sp.]
MDLERESIDFRKSAHLILLTGYSIFVVMHIIISFLLGWDKWILLLVVAGVIASWYLHISGTFKAEQRFWLIASFMMCTYFIYGTHLTSTFDNAVVMAALMMFFILIRMKGLITFCQITFYITYTYDIVMLARTDFEFDMTSLCRIVMNYSVVTMFGYFSKLTISKWDNIMKASQSEIDTLTESTERLNDFLANVSHEIRTPVNAIIGLSGICIEKEKNPEMKRNLVEVSTAGHKIAEQIGDILDFSEIDRGRLVKNDEDYMVSSMMNDLANDFRVLKKEELELVIAIDPDIPAVLHGDISKLKKIIRALISNSFKFTSQGGVYLSLEADKRDYGINLCIEVSDTGCGMTQEEIEKVSERFYQSDSGRSRATNGLGLGLGIVSGFVSLMGGFMTISSTVGEGTTVKISIPQAVVDPARCISINDSKEFSLCAFLDLGSFENPMVREYYNRQSARMARSLALEMHRALTAEGLSKIVSTTKLTHLLVGETEYLENRNLIDSIAAKVLVIIVSEPGNDVERKSGIRLMEKPFYAFPLVSLLNSGVKVNEEYVAEGSMRVEGISVLVVDDEPMNLVVAKSIFKKYGMKVFTAPSGYKSVDMCKEQAFDLIFMDHMMSGMDGVEAMKKIRSDVKGVNRETPCIALTANAMSSAKQMFMAEGFDGFVSKPIEIEELERTLKKILPKNLITYVIENVEPAVESTESNDDASESDALEFDALEFDADFGEAEEITGHSEAFITIKHKLESYGIDVDTGLSFTRDDSELYLEVVNQFAGEMDERIAKLRDFYEKKDWKNYEILIHGTKSSAKMIGAIELSEEARLLEEAAEKRDTAYIDANHEHCMESCRVTGDQLMDTLGIEKKLDVPLGNDVEPEDDVLEFDPV